MSEDGEGAASKSPPPAGTSSISATSAARTSPSRTALRKGGRRSNRLGIVHASTRTPCPRTSGRTADIVWPPLLRTDPPRATVTSDVSTLRKALECIAHYNVTTAGLRIEGNMMVYGYTDCAAVYVSFPADTQEWHCAIPLAHLVKLLRTCAGHSVTRLEFFPQHLRVVNEVMYDVSYVDVPPPTLRYPTVRPVARYRVTLPTLFRFLRMAGDDVQVDCDHGLKMETTYQDMVKSRIDFPTFEDTMMTLFGVPLLCNESWEGPCTFSTVLLKQLCRSQSFATQGVWVLCRSHAVFESVRDGVLLHVCFSTK